MQKSMNPDGISFIERPLKKTTVRKAGTGCETILKWTGACLDKYWRMLYCSLGETGAEGAMRALLGQGPDMKKMRFIDSTLERWSGDIVAMNGKNGTKENGLHVRKLVFAVSYLGKLCKFAGNNDAASYVKFLDEKIRDGNNAPRGAAAGMLLKEQLFQFAIGMAEEEAKSGEPTPFPDRERTVKKTPPARNPDGIFRLELPDEMKAESEAEMKAALAACKGMVVWEIANAALGLRQAATYTAENSPENGKNGKSKSRRTLDAINGSGFFVMLAYADRLGRNGILPGIENAAKLWKNAGDCAKGAQELASQLHAISDGKLARRITYLAQALSFLESGDIAGAMKFWEETLPSKVKGRADGVETGLAAKSLLEDKELSLAFAKIGEAAKYAPAIAV